MTAGGGAITPETGQETGAQLRAGNAAEAEATRYSDAEIEAATRAQRRNMLWEYTQAGLAVSLTLATIYASLAFAGDSVVVGANGGTASVPVPETLKNALFVVLGFYFGRTNHSRPVPSQRPMHDE